MTQSPSIYIAVLMALGGGVAIAMQSTSINAISGTIGPVRLAFFIHVGGTIMGAVMLGLLALRGPLAPVTGDTTRLSLIFLFTGLMGMITLPAIATSFPRIGLVAGQIALIIGQTVVALAVDSFGLAGSTPIPLTWQRVAGLVLMAVATYLVLPRST